MKWCLYGNIGLTNIGHYRPSSKSQKNIKMKKGSVALQSFNWTVCWSVLRSDTFNDSEFFVIYNKVEKKKVISMSQRLLSYYYSPM